VVVLKPIQPESAASFRAVRLEALRESPLAFGSTYAKESLLTEPDWSARARQWTSGNSRAWLAWCDGQACGIVACFLDSDDRQRAVLASMWVAPTHRRHGLGRLLVEEAKAWATSAHAKAIALMVTSSNAQAIHFYEQLGFIRTGRTEPYPNDPSLVEFEMKCILV